MERKKDGRNPRLESSISKDSSNTYTLHDVFLHIYDQEFPSLEKKTDPVTKVSTKPYIIPTEVGPEGKLKSPSQAEEVLNWQTDNVRAQNHLLKKIDEKIDKICTQVSTNDEKLQYLSKGVKKQYHQLSKEIRRMEKDHFWSNF